MARVWRGIQNTISWLLTIALILIFAIVLFQKLGGEVPGVFGYHLMYVLTGSMAPEIKAGDAIIVHEVAGASVQAGDVICYYSTEKAIEGELVTHEVIKAPYEQNGEIFLQTKGTANLDADQPIRADQVYGKMLLKLAWMGKLFSLFRTIPGLILCVVPIVLLMVSEIRHLTVCAREEKEEAVRNAILNEREGQKQ